jgi:hypothetical protein
MPATQREFFRSARGPRPADLDTWSLVFDPDVRRLLVRHEWRAAGHGGVAEFDIADFLKQDGAAPTALIEDLIAGSDNRQEVWLPIPRQRHPIGFSRAAWRGSPGPS